MVSNVSADTLDALTQFGHHLGMCFQIVDDVLDVTRTEAELGKPAGNDVLEGVYTLPVIYAVAASRRAARPARAQARVAAGRRVRSSSIATPDVDRRVDGRRAHARDEGVRGARRRDRARPRRVRPAAHARRRARAAVQLSRMRGSDPTRARACSCGASTRGSPKTSTRTSTAGHDDMRIEMPTGAIEGADEYRKLVTAGFALGRAGVVRRAPPRVRGRHGDVVLADWTIRARRRDDDVVDRLARPVGVRAPRRQDRVVARASPRAARP